MNPASADLVVVLPGILGSTLRHEGHLVWAPSAGSALRAISTFGRSIKKLQVSTGTGDDHPGDGVEPVSLMPDLHVLPGIWTMGIGYDRLLHRLHTLGYREANAGGDAPPGNLLPVPYDWRLSNRYNGQRLKKIAEPALEQWRAQGGPYTDAQLVFVCHSMGGLVARWYIEQCGGAEVTRKLITIGTPFRGAARALAPLVNGMPRKLGQFGENLAEFALSLPSLYQLLPEYACLAFSGAPEGLAKTTEVSLPGLSTKMTADAMLFHTTLHESESKRPESLAITHAIVGTRQKTETTATLKNGQIEFLSTYEGEDLGGDGTVPGVGASRADVPLDSNSLCPVPCKHGRLQGNKTVLDVIEDTLKARAKLVRDGGNQVSLRVTVPEFAVSGEPITAEVTPCEPVRYPIGLTVKDEAGRLLESRILTPANGTISATFDSLPRGAHTIDAGDPDRAANYVPVSSGILIWGR
jgi:pimeloyl-ACP methyl ester carboxylesterase